MYSSRMQRMRQQDPHKRYQFRLSRTNCEGTLDLARDRRAIIETTALECKDAANAAAPPTKAL
jgi:hypothetical protein